jgi:hypothetical protein
MSYKIRCLETEACRYHEIRPLSPSWWFGHLFCTTLFPKYITLTEWKQFLWYSRRELHSLLRITQRISPKVAALWTAFQLCIRHIPDSNLGQGINCIQFDVLWFYSVHPGEWDKILKQHTADSFLAFFFRKIKVRLWDDYALCVSLCLWISPELPVLPILSFRTQNYVTIIRYVTCTVEATPLNIATCLWHVETNNAGSRT